MSTNFGDLPSTEPLKTGKSQRLDGGPTGAYAWPSAGNYIWFGPGAPGSGSPGQVGPINRPERFYWKAGASIIAWCSGGWTRFDMQLRLVNISGTPVNDLFDPGGSYTYFQKADSVEGGSGHVDPWVTSSIQGVWWCEANTSYYIQLISNATPAGVNYWIGMPHQTMWSYTVGEGAT